MKRHVKKKGGGKVIEDYTLFLICIFFIGFFLFPPFSIVSFSPTVCYFVCAAFGRTRQLAFWHLASVLMSPFAYPVYVRTMILNFLFL